MNCIDARKRKVVGIRLRTGCQWDVIPSYLVAALLALVASGCGESHRTPPTAHRAAALSPTVPSYPKYNQVYRKAGHNSYWVPYHFDGNLGQGSCDFGHAAFDACASGTRERIIDQLLHERTRFFELDIHRDDGHPGHFKVYHTDTSDNSTCYDVESCLQIFKRFDYLMPDHEVVNIMFEAKAMNGPFDGGPVLLGRVFENDHNIVDFDRTIWELLGPRLYTPREFLDRCTGDNRNDLTACLAEKGWPTTDELRGRYIVNFLANQAENYWDWFDYATTNIRERAAFPMRSVLQPKLYRDLPDDARNKFAPLADVVEGPWVEYLMSFDFTGQPDVIHAWLNDPNFKVRLAAARRQSIFWTVERGDYADIASFLTSGGIIRGNDATAWNNDFGAQGDQAGRGIQMIMIDRQFAFIHDGDTGVFGPAGFIPTDTSRAFFDPAIAAGNASTIAAEALVEPGNRLYLHTSQRAPALGSALVKVQPQSVFNGDVWETQPSTTRPPVNGLIPPAVRGDGCLYATTADHQNAITICRQMLNNNGPNLPYYEESEDARIRVWTMKNGQESKSDYYVPHNHPSPTDVGDLLQMTVLRQGTTSTVTVRTAGTFNARGQPQWNPLTTETFSAELDWQGLFATNDVEFVGTKHNGGVVHGSDFTLVDVDGSGLKVLEDQSYCLDGQCRSAQSQVPQVRTETLSDPNGAKWLRIHRQTQYLFGAVKHNYTPDLIEAGGAGGFNDENSAYFYVAISPMTSPTKSIFRCVDWRTDVQRTWLTNDVNCGQGSDPAGLEVQLLGSSLQSPLPGTMPLDRVRQGNDDVATVDPGEVAFRVKNGGTVVEHLGYVYPTDSQALTGVGYGFGKYALQGWCTGSGSTFGIGNFDGRLGDDFWCHDPATGNTWIALSNGQGGFSDTGVLTKWCGFPTGRIGAADFNGDGKDDLWCHDFDPNSSTGGGTWVALSNGQGGFSDTGVLYRSCSFPTAEWGVADMDGDGRADLWCHDFGPTSSTSGDVWVETWNGNGFTDRGIWIQQFCRFPTAQFGTADFDGDGRADLWCRDVDGTSSTGGRIWTARNSGTSDANGFQNTSVFFPSGCAFPSAEFGVDDFDGDGRADLWCHDKDGGSTTGGDVWIATWNGSDFTNRGIWTYNFCDNGVAQFGSMHLEQNGLRDRRADLYCRQGGITLAMPSTPDATDGITLWQYFYGDGDIGQCNGAAYGLSSATLNNWTPAVRVDTDSRPGGCQQQFAILDPANKLANVSFSVDFEGDSGQCGTMSGSLGVHSIHVGTSNPVPWSTPYRIDTSNAAGGCSETFRIDGPDVVALDISIEADDAAGAGQCPTAGTYTATSGHPVTVALDTDDRPGGCRQRFRLRKR